MFSLTRNALESSLGRRILSSRVSRHASRAASLAVLVAALLWLSLAGVTSPSPTSAQPLPTLNHTFPAGWSLVSIPLQPQNGTPAAVFDEVPPPLRLNTYRDGDTVAADQPDYPDITPGRADWLLLTEETSVSVSGNFVSIAGDFEYPLSSGWNPVSTPWSAPIDWADARVSIRNGSTTLPLSQAICQGWGEAELTAFDPATDAYSTIAANQPTPGQLLPWSGYLLFSNIDGFITFSPPPAPHPGEPASIESTLSSDIALAGTTVTIENTVRDVLGTVLDPQPPLEFTITPVANTTGPVPTIASNVVSLDPAARGSFDIQSLVTGTVVADTVTLTVMAPTAQKQEFADFSQNLNTASTSFASAIEALEGGDTAAASKAKADLQGVAASIDLRRLQIAAPFSPEGGFPPTLGQLVAAGYAPQPADTAYVNLFASIISEYETLIPLVEALDPSTATGVDVANLNAHATTLTGLLAQLQSSNPTLYGVTANSAQLTVLVGQLLPKVTQLLAEKGVASLTAAGVPDAPSLSVAELRLPTRSLVAGGRVAALGHMRAMPGPPVSEPRRVAALFSLAELMVAQNIQLELAKQIYGPAMKDAANMAILSALANLLQPFAGSNLCPPLRPPFLHPL